MSLVDEIGGSRGILTLLGFQQTIGSRNLAPLTLRQCLAAFKKRHTPGEQLTVGASFQQTLCTNECDVEDIHILSHAHATMEIRNALGYGARWDAETKAFRGFLEPPMTNGHKIKWKH
ncbi:unnamed protein product [Peronospora belbahrii]|uniref:Uncharacterized protein n=1 Tax=Peronospora belbahrii TaxID=622444 RepID=A0ABN8D6J8_9STRA|nr:unnamed protein product [Peronospora belbahrii]